jgi:hypothetical protein
MEKKCTKCGEVKDFDEFSKDKRNKDGKQSRCKNCNTKYSLENKHNKNRKAPTEEQKERRKKHRQENKEFFKKKDREYNQKNKHIRQKYRKDNKERLLKYTHEYYQNNKKKIRILRDKWFKENMKTNPLHKLRVSIRSNIAMSIKNQGYTKKTKTYNMLKCDYDFFMQWLNGIASNGYQYGFGNLELDHVVPISLAETEDEAILLSHYSNYQLLNATENQSKGNRYVNPTNLKRVLEHHPNPDKIREIHARL